MQYLFGLTLLLAPTYAVRFGLFGIPLNLLMMWMFFLWLLFACWILNTRTLGSFGKWAVGEIRRYQTLLAALFLLAGLVSLFVGSFSQEKLGQFLVLFLQPIITFFIIRYLVATQRLRLTALVWPAFLFVSVAGIYAIIQYFTLLGVPVAWWGNSEEPKRALTFFLHPNFYALFVTPLLAFLVPVVSEQWSVNRKNTASSLRHAQDLNLGLFTIHYSLFTAIAWLLGAIGLFLSLSRGGWLGLATAIGVYLLVAGNRKLIKSALMVFVIGVLVVLAVPNFRYRLLLPFQGEKSAVSRLSIWSTGWKEIKDNPITGKGLLGFKNNWPTYNTDPNLEPHPTPHNLYLALWVDIGLLGLLSFLAVCAIGLWRGLNKDRTILQLSIALSIVAILVHGLVDTPYLKNDLALVFWLLFSFV